MKRMLILLSAAVTLAATQLFAVDAARLQYNLSHLTPPFNYPLNIAVYPSNKPDAELTVCFHGSGADYQTAGVVSRSVDEHVVGFDFPGARQSFSNASVRGTIADILPAIYVLKQCLIAGNLNSINLYGFSKGGGDLVNVLAVLNRHDYDAELRAIGVSQHDKQSILQAVQKGYVIIDSPFKSIEELMEARGEDPQVIELAQLYKKNRLRPIDSLNDMQGLSLTVLVNFQDPDLAVQNRDDQLFAERLKNANKQGKTIVIISHDEGHLSYHPELWEAYRRLKHMH